MSIEKRFQLALDAEIRGQSGRGLVGYAAVFDRQAQLGEYRETVRPGAFTTSLAEKRDILALSNHDVNQVLARTAAGTLKLAEDSRGLHFEIDALPDTTYANDVLELVRSGNVGGCSFCFSVPAGGDSWQGRSRELRSVTLHEISVISGVPAYSGTVVQARSQIDGTVALLRRMSLAVS